MKVSVIISLKEDSINKIDEIVTTLVNAGLEVTNIFQTIGVLSGKLDENIIPEFRKLSDIVAVELEKIATTQSSNSQKPYIGKIKKYL
jgi:hypothetical protein